MSRQVKKLSRLGDRNTHLGVGNRWQVVEHYVTRVRGSLELMERLDLIGRTSELARLFGIQFYEVSPDQDEIDVFFIS